MGTLQTLAKALTNDGLALPAPVRSCLEGKPQPLALDTRERLADWCAAHGYSEQQRQRLNKLDWHHRTRRPLSSGHRIRSVTHRSRRHRHRACFGHRARGCRQRAGRHRGEAKEARSGHDAGAVGMPEPEPEPLPETVPEPPVASDALQALASAVDAAMATPVAQASPSRASPRSKSGCDGRYRARPAVSASRQSDPMTPASSGRSVRRLRCPASWSVKQCPREQQAERPAHDRNPSQDRQARRCRCRAICLGG